MLEPNRYDASMLWAAAWKCYLRSGEGVVPSDTGFDSNVLLANGDVRVDDVYSPNYLEVRLKVFT